SLNSTSTFYDFTEAIDKRYQKEIKYCQLMDFKIKYIPIGLLHMHILSQFFLSVDKIIDLQTETMNENFIEDIVDEPQIILKAILDNMNILNIIETYICTCIESITKGIIYDILMKLNNTLDDLLVFIALESFTKINTILLTFGIIFSIAKTAINIALETECNTELIKLLKDFILNKKRNCDEDSIELEDNKDIENNNQISDIEISERNHVIYEITNQTNIQEDEDNYIILRSQ
ncbi:hypothetical protein C1645_750165, partial [Glomus cerebriforme]